MILFRNRLQYYGRLLKNNESTRRLKKSRLLDVLQRLEIQEIESLRKKELTLMSHLSSLQAVSGISHVVFAFLLIVNIVCIPRVIPHIAPLIPNNVFESIVEVVRKVLRTSLPLVPIHQDVQRSSSLIQLLVLSVFIPLLKWVQVIESKTSQPLLRKDSERSTIPNYGADLFSSLDKSQGLKLTNWICKLKHGDDSTLLVRVGFINLNCSIRANNFLPTQTCSEEFVPGKVSLLHVPTAEDVVVLDSLFQHICGVQQSNLLIEGELSLHGSTLMLNDKLLDKTDFLCYIGNEGKLCSQAGDKLSTNDFHNSHFIKF